MDSSSFVNSLKHNAEVIRTILKNINSEQAHWKPAPQKWSMLEVVHHLYDEEREDFRSRLNFTLTDPKTEWPGIDPPRWVIERKYNQQDFLKTQRWFFEERQESVDWLETLSSPRWENTYHHPKIGKITAGDLLTSWVAHDFLHIRQLTTLNLLYCQKLATPYDIKYALP